MFRGPFKKKDILSFQIKAVGMDLFIEQNVPFTTLF